MTTISTIALAVILTVLYAAYQRWHAEPDEEEYEEWEEHEEWEWWEEWHEDEEDEVVTVEVHRRMVGRGLTSGDMAKPRLAAFSGPGPSWCWGYSADQVKDSSHW